MQLVSDEAPSDPVAGDETAVGCVGLRTLRLDLCDAWLSALRTHANRRLRNLRLEVDCLPSLWLPSLTMNMTTGHNIYDRVRQVAADIAAKVRDGSITVDESEALHTDDGLIVDGVAAWHVAGEIRTFTRCTSCDTYAEDAQKIRLS